MLRRDGAVMNRRVFQISTCVSLFSLESVQKKVSTAALQFSGVAFSATSLPASSVRLYWKAALLKSCVLSLESITVK